MSVIKEERWETANARWFIEVKALQDGFRCDYFGTSPKFAPVKPPTGRTAMMSDMGRGSVLGKNVEALLEQVRRAVEAIDGPIEGGK